MKIGFRKGVQAKCLKYKAFLKILLFTRLKNPNIVMADYFFKGDLYEQKKRDVKKIAEYDSIIWYFIYEYNAKF